MRIQKKDGSRERSILTGMIVDRSVVATIATRWQREMFRSPWSNIIGKWCVDYFRKYDEAPGSSIEKIFAGWEEDHPDDTQGKLISRFLSSLSGDYEDEAAEINCAHLLDIAGAHFNRVRLERLSEKIQGDIETGDVEGAQSRVDGHTNVELGVGSAVDVYHDTNAIREAFEQRAEPLVRYNGALGKFINHALERDSFIAFMAPEKRGKSFWLMDMAYRAILQRKRVAFFSAGDMSQGQNIQRFAIRAAKKPRFPCDINYPKSITHEPDEPAEVETILKEYTSHLTWREAAKAAKQIQRKCKSEKPFLRMSCHPADTLSVDGIRSTLETWQNQDWMPDIVIVDYADILATPGGVDLREKTNSTWIGLRSLSQRLHCLVVTATQSDAAGYAQETLDRQNFSDDKRKLAHVNGMIGINQTPEEKETGIYRLNWIALRESEYNVGRCVHVASCLALANPCVRSCF